MQYLEMFGLASPLLVSVLPGATGSECGCLSIISYNPVEILNILSAKCFQKAIHSVSGLCNEKYIFEWMITYSMAESIANS